MIAGERFELCVVAFCKRAGTLAKQDLPRDVRAMFDRYANYAMLALFLMLFLFLLLLLFLMLLLLLLISA